MKRPLSCAGAGETWQRLAQVEIAAQRAALDKSHCSRSTFNTFILTNARVDAGEAQMLRKKKVESLSGTCGVLFISAISAFPDST
jgi:hypothetical protein